MQTYSYRTQMLPLTATPLENALNELGRDGWRLIKLVTSSTPATLGLSNPINSDRLLGIFIRETNAVAE